LKEKTKGVNPMELFKKLFGKYINLFYHCFDRIIINGYIINLMNEQSIVYFFKNVNKIPIISKEVISKRTNDYQKWVESFISNNKIPWKWAKDKERKEDVVNNYLKKFRCRNQTGVYFIFKSMEQGRTFYSCIPKFKTRDDNYRIIKKCRRRFTHYYFYILDPVLGNMSIRVGSFFPFNTTYWLNGHSYIETELLKRNIDFKKDDNAFLNVDNALELQKIADSLSPEIIQRRLDYWTLAIGPKFSKKERQAMKMERLYAIAQVEYCFNFVMKKNFPIRNLFQKACQSAIISFLSDKVSYIFGQRITRRLKGKLVNILQSYKRAHHVFSLHFKNSFIKQYEKFITFLRNEITSNNLREFGIGKLLKNLPKVREIFLPILDRFTSFQAETFNIHFDFDIFPELSKPIVKGKTKIPGIKLQDERIIRLMETLLKSPVKFSPANSREIYNQLLELFNLNENNYSLNQFRYDLRKLISRGILERLDKTYKYRLTEYGIKVSISFTLLRKNVYGPILNSQFNFKPNNNYIFCSKLEKAYYKVDKDFTNLCNLLAA